MKLKIFFYLFIIGVIFSLLFSLSDVNFKWEYLKALDVLRNFSYVGIPSLIIAWISIRVSKKAMKNREKDDSLKSINKDHTSSD
jgi:hypothetical protein